MSDVALKAVQKATETGFMGEMSMQFWIGTAVSVASGFIIWAGRTIYIRDRKNVARIEQLEREKVADSEDRFAKNAREISNRVDKIYVKFESATEELNKKLQQNILQMTKFEVMLGQFSDLIVVVGRLKDDMSNLKGQMLVREKRKSYDDDDDGGRSS